MIGIDVVDVARFRSVLERSPAFPHRFFSADEISYCRDGGDFALHLAATFAAKEAVVKALSPAAPSFRAVEIARGPSGAPVGRARGRQISLSISHDGPVAIAVAIAL